MDDLILWLRAQIDEDERVARAAQSAECDVFDGTGVVVMHAATGTRSVTLTSTVATHIARHDPARVLTEVAAKRTLLDALEAPVTAENVADEEGLILAVRIIATAYADQPSYCDEWRPA